VNVWLRDDLALGKGKVALDLGAGTGKFLAYLRNTEATVIAVEPVPAMLAQLVNLHPGVEARQGSAERIPLADSSVDAVVCAQSFHWFANINALSEIRRILKRAAFSGSSGTFVMNAWPGLLPCAQFLIRTKGTPLGITRKCGAGSFLPLASGHFLKGISRTATLVRLNTLSWIACFPRALLQRSPQRNAIV